MGQRGPDQPQQPTSTPSGEVRQPSQPGGAQPRADERQLKALQHQRQERLVKVAVALAIVVILIIFVIANSDPVKVNFVFVTRHPRLIWVMIACAVLGGVAGYLIGRPGRHPGAGGRVKDQRQH